ncbi:MAG TPA: hypothetical protein PK760_10620, partial [Flavobacteriales bacterium]|nr:hypothetical protein [Flavobacteriales bacterium]
MGFLADNMGHFGPFDIANLLFAVLMAALLGFVLARFGCMVNGIEARSTSLWSAVMALAAGFVRTQLPLAVILLALVLLVRRGDESK